MDQIASSPTGSMNSRTGGALVQDSFYKELLDSLHDGVYFVDADRRITYWNQGAERITGYSTQSMVGLFCHANRLDHITDEGRHLCFDGCPLMETIRDGKPREAEVYLRHAEGHRVPVLVRTAPIHDRQGQITGAVEIFSNNQVVLRYRRQVDHLEQAVLRDPLTQLGNRAFLETKIATALHEYRQFNVPFGLLFMDVDHFKSINDTYGHSQGDLALQTVARTLLENLRSTDACGRWGGEEFLVLLNQVDEHSLAKVAEKFRAMIAHSLILYQGARIPLTVSIGATLFQPQDTNETIIQRADQLMYISKQKGRNCATVET
jgi:diguanylate cyclase (GGDEF)-like protein/PAS domain S-box-containing protein